MHTMMLQRPHPHVASTSSVLFLIWAITLLLFVLHDQRAAEDYASQQKLRGTNAVHRILTLIDEEQAIPSLFPFLVKDYVGFVAAVAALMLSAGGGIGGGGILVPIYILIFDFSVKHAIPLVSVTVLGGAVANNIFNVSKRHPNHPMTRSCIDWDLLLQLEPMTSKYSVSSLLRSTVLKIQFFY